MASRTTARLTVAGPPVPAMGTLPSAANQLFPKGTIVSRNASGQAVSPSSADSSGFPAMGVSSATYDNRTGSEAGGLAGDLDVEVQYGVYGFGHTGTTPKSGDVAYYVDNQTVSVDGGGGVAGIVSEVRDGQCFVWFGPHVPQGISLAVQSVSLEIEDADLTDTDGSQSFNLGSALPSNAVLLGYHVSVTEAFTDGSSGDFDIDIGVSGALTAIADSVDLNNIAELGASAGGRRSGQLLATVTADVNVDTATAGAATVEVFYVLA